MEVDGERREDGRRCRKKARWKEVEKEGKVDDEKQFRGEIRNLLLLPLSRCLLLLGGTNTGCGR